MTRTPYLIGGALIGLALVLLLGYSLDRTSWLLSLYEAETPGTLATWLNVSPLALGVAAAAVIEAGAVALIIADALGKLNKEIAPYVWAGLVVVVLVQGFANLLAGFLRGFQAPITQLVAQGVEKDMATGVAVAAWLVANAAIPLLIFILAKLEARVFAVALAVTPQAHTATPQDDTAHLPQDVPIAEAYKQLEGLTYYPPAPQDDPLWPAKVAVWQARTAGKPTPWSKLEAEYDRKTATLRGWFEQVEAVRTANA